MKLLVNSAADLIEHAEAYFRTTKRRCYDHEGATYLKGAGATEERCVIGAVLLCETEYERYWLRCFKGIAPGILAGLFGIHPNTKLARAAFQVQQLHDEESNWINGAGFMAWDKLAALKREYQR